MSNARAISYYAATGKYHNKSLAVEMLEAQIKAAQDKLDEQVRLEFPVGSIVTVEDRFHRNRFINGPVHAHVSCTHYKGAGMWVDNTKTGKRRWVSLYNYVFKEE